MTAPEPLAFEDADTPTAALGAWVVCIEKHDPRHLAVWACSSLSEARWCSEWDEGCSDDILDSARRCLAGLSSSGEYVHDPEVARLLLRIHERLDGHWPVLEEVEGRPMFVFHLRRWWPEIVPRTTGIGSSPGWEHAILARPVDAPFLSDVVPDPSAIAGWRCNHPARGLHPARRGGYLAAIYPPPDVPVCDQPCIRVFLREADYGATLTTKIRDGVEVLMSRAGR